MNTAISQRFKDKTGNLDKAAVIQNSLAAAKAQIAANAALGIDPDRLIAIVASAVIRTPALLNCTPQSIVEATIKAARYGLDPSGITGDGFLVPFKDRAEFICGYRGLVKLAMRHPRVKLVEARLVHANDKFEIDYGRENPIRHKIALKDRGDPIGCYARAFLDGSPPAVEWMDADEINRVRNQSKSFQKYPGDSPWTHHWGEMARKTVLRRMIKFLPLEFEISLAVADLDAVDYPQFAAPAATVLSGNGAKPIAEEKPEKPKAEAKPKKAEAPAEDVEAERSARVNAERYSQLVQLRQVYAFDLEKEVERCRYSRMTDEQFKDHLAIIRENYKRIPVGERLPPLGAAVELDEAREQYSEDIRRRALEIAKRKKEAGESCTYEDILEAVKAGKM